MIQRRGPGKVRHLDVRHLHLQELLRNGHIAALEKLGTKENVADIGTTYHDNMRMEELLGFMHMYPFHNHIGVSNLSVRPTAPSSLICKELRKLILGLDRVLKSCQTSCQVL